MSKKSDRNLAMHPDEWKHNVGAREKYEASIMRKPVEAVELPESEEPTYETMILDGKLEEVLPEVAPIKKHKSRTKFCKKTQKPHEWGIFTRHYFSWDSKKSTKAWQRECLKCHKQDIWYPPSLPGTYFDYDTSVMPPGSYEPDQKFPCENCKKDMEQIGQYEYKCPCSPNLRVLIA